MSLDRCNLCGFPAYEIRQRRCFRQANLLRSFGRSRQPVTSAWEIDGDSTMAGVSSFVCLWRPILECQQPKPGGVSEMQPLMQVNACQGAL